MKKRIMSFLICATIIGGMFGNQFNAYADDNMIANTAESEMMETTTYSEETPSYIDGLEVSSGETVLDNTGTEAGGVSDENNTAEVDTPIDNGIGIEEGVEILDPAEPSDPSSIEVGPNFTTAYDDDDMGLIIDVTEEDMDDVEVVIGLDPEKPKEETTEKYVSYIRLADATDTFFGGEIITVYNGVTISGNMAIVPGGSYTLVYLPKDSFEQPGMKDISLSFEKIEEAEILEDEQNYIIKTIYKDLYGGYNSATPFRVSLKRGLTKKLSQHNIKQEFYTSDGVLKSESQLMVKGKAKLESASSSYNSSTRMVSEVDKSFVVKENTFITFGPSYISFPNLNELDPRDRRIFASIPEGTKVKEGTGWTYDKASGKWYKDLSVKGLDNVKASITLDLGGIDLSEHDSEPKAKILQVDFSAQPVENGEVQTDLGSYTWLARKGFYILKVEEVKSAYMNIGTIRRISYMNKDYGLYQNNSWWNSISTVSIPYDKSKLENIRIFIDHQTLSSYSFLNSKGDEDTRKLIITSAATKLPLYSYPSQVRLNIIGNDENGYIRNKLEGTKAYGIKFDDTKELITDNVPIISTSDLNSSVNDDDWFKLEPTENQYKTIVFEFSNGGVELTGEEEIKKFYSIIHANVVSDLRERLVDDLKTKMDNNEEPFIAARGTNIAGYPIYDDRSHVYVKEWFKVKDSNAEASEISASASSDTDTYYSLQYETISKSTLIGITNGKAFFVEDTLSTELSYEHKRNGKASDATQPDNLNIYYLVPDGLEPVENKDVFAGMEIIRGYKDGYNLVVVKPNKVEIPNLIPTETAISRTTINRFNLDFKATKRLDIGTYSIYACMCIDNNAVDIKNGRQYGILQLDTPAGYFDQITKNAKNRPEVSNKFTNLGAQTFTIYPPQSLVALKDVKMSNEENTKFSSSVGTKATIGDEIDYRIRLKNNSTSEIRTLTLIDVLPFDGDKTIVENQEGKYLSRGSKFRTPLISIDAQDKFDIYYTTDPVKETVDENKNANWQKQVDDMSKVTMFKAVLKPGQAIKVNEVFDIITHNVIATDQDINDKERAYNSYALSLNNELSFIETMKTEVEVNYAKNDVTIEKIDANDESIKLEGVTFDLYYNNDELVLSNITTNRNGIAVIPDLLVGRNYYLKETSTADGYTLYELKIPFTVSDQAENNKIVIKNSKDLVSVSVAKKWAPKAGGAVKVSLMARR